MNNIIRTDIDIFNLNVDLESNLGLELPPDYSNEAVNNTQTANKFNIEDIDIEFIDDDILYLEDEETDVDLAIGDEQDIIEEDSIDYTSLINNLRPSVKKAQRTMYDSINSLRTEFDISITKNDFKLLNEVQYHVYYEFMSDTIEKCLQEGTRMPACSDMCAEFLKICEESGWYFGLYKDEFVHTFETNYNYLLNEVDNYRAEDSKQRNYLFNQEDIADIDFTYNSMNSIVDFPVLCAHYLTSLDNINLETDITMQLRNSPLSHFIDANIITIQDLIATVQNVLKSSEVHELLLTKMNFNTSMVSLDEIIRLLFVLDFENSLFILDDFKSVDLDQVIFIAMTNRLKKDKNDIFAFLVLSIFYIIVMGTPTKNEKYIKTMAFELAYTYKNAVASLKESPNLKTPAFITSITFSNNDIFIGCSKGKERYKLELPFYLIAGSATNMVKTPIASFCYCDDRNCCGCLFPSNIFISHLIDWTDSGALEINRKQAIRFKTYLSPKEIGNMISSVNIENMESKKYKISKDTERWFLSFQNYIRDFSFVDDGFEPKIINFEFTGEITEEMQIPNLLPGDTVHIKILGIEQFHGKGNNTFKLLKLILNGEEITEGDIATDTQTLFISYFTKDNFETQYIELPLLMAPAYEIANEFVKEENFDELNYAVLNTGNTDIFRKFDTYERYRHIARVLSDLTGNQFDLLNDKAAKQLIGCYGYLLEFHIIHKHMLRFVLSSFIPWLESGEYISDIVNFECLKSLLCAIDGDNNILKDCKYAEDITDEMRDAIKHLATDKVDIASIIEKWYQLDQDLLANIVINLDYDYKEEFEQIYYDLLCIPESRDFLLTLQNKMIISMICMNYSRKSILFSVIPFLAKIFRNNTTPDFDALQNKIQKNFKQYRNKQILPTVFQVRNTPHIHSVENISLLRTFTLTRNIFGMLNTLNVLHRQDIVDMILAESKAPAYIDAEYFNSFQNEQEFLDILKTMNIEDMFITCREIILNFIYDGAKQDILSKEKIMSILAYDLLINIYDILFLDFDIADTYDELPKDMLLLPSLALTYCLIEGEAVFDVNEGKNRAISYKEHPECFPLMGKVASSGNAVDFLYVSGGD